MSFALRLSLCFLALSLGLISPRPAQSQSTPNPPTSSEINDLAKELADAMSEEEQYLMLSFHRRLQAPRAAGKLTKAESLRRAALELMKNPETNHPFYWAGFVLVGDGR
jgi:CHAT domain